MNLKTFCAILNREFGPPFLKEGKVKEAEHDLVVLSVGIRSNPDVKAMFNGNSIELDDYNFVKQVDELINPAKTSINGVFVAGTASGPMDIPDSILSAGAASSETASYIRKHQVESSK